MLDYFTRADHLLVRITLFEKRVCHVSKQTTAFTIFTNGEEVASDKHKRLVSCRFRVHTELDGPALQPWGSGSYRPILEFPASSLGPQVAEEFPELYSRTGPG